MASTLGPAVAMVGLLAAGGWEEVGRADGVVVEAREVKGSPHRELKATTVVKLPVAALCDAAFGPAEFDPTEPALKSRKVLSQSTDELVHYDQMVTPVLTDRDCVVQERRERRADGSCRITADAVVDPGAPVRQDHVRIDAMRSSWLFEPKPSGETAITYLVWADPKVSLPTAFVEPSRRDNAVQWVKLVIQRASRRAAAAPAPSK
jgi:hypothetical protein